MGAAFVALTALKVAVGGRRAALALGQLVGVHRQTHGAARETPLKAGLFEDIGQALFFGLGPDQTGAGDDHGAHAVLDLVALQDGSSGAQILDPAVGAGADEHSVDLDLGERRAGLQPHVIQRPRDGVDLAALEIRRCGHFCGDRQHVFGGGAPCDRRRNLFAFQRHHLVEMRALIGEERLPIGKCCLPRGAFRGMRTAHAILIGRFIRRDQTSARATLDGHVADSHAAFHRQIANGLAAIFDDVAGAARRACLADDGHGDVFRSDAGAQLAGDFHLHVLGFLLDQRLRGQNVLHFRCADAMRQRAERTMGRGVAVAANNSHAGQRPALLRPHDMHDALTHVGDGVVVDAELLGVLIKRINLNAAVFGHGGGIGAVQRGRHVVIRHGDGFLGRTHGAACHAQALKGLRRGDLMDQMAVDVEKAGAVLGLMGDMCVPDFIIERFWGTHGFSPEKVMRILTWCSEKAG